MILIAREKLPASFCYYCVLVEAILPIERS